MSFESFNEVPLVESSEGLDPIAGVDNNVSLGPNISEEKNWEMQKSAAEELKAFSSNPETSLESFRLWADETQLASDRNKESNEKRLDYQLGLAEMYIDAGLVEQALEELASIEQEVEWQGLGDKGYVQALAALRNVINSSPPIE